MSPAFQPKAPPGKRKIGRQPSIDRLPQTTRNATAPSTVVKGQVILIPMSSSRLSARVEKF